MSSSDQDTFSTSSIRHYIDKCELIEGLFASVLQLGLAFACLFVLLFKRFLEKPKRPWKIWFMDTSKQAFSAGLAHFGNMLIAIILSYLGHKGGRGKPAERHECSWYLITFSIDILLGSLWSYLGVLVTEKLCGTLLKLKWLAHSGYYGDPPSYKRFAAQLFAWVIVVLVSRVFNALVEVAAFGPLDYLADLIGFPLRHHPELFLAAVMIICPIFMNIGQVLIQDAFLKSSKIIGKRKDEVHTLPGEPPITDGTSEERTRLLDVPPPTQDTESDEQQPVVELPPPAQTETVVVQISDANSVNRGTD